MSDKDMLIISMRNTELARVVIAKLKARNAELERELAELKGAINAGIERVVRG